MSLEKRLCRLVWSEWTHGSAEDHSLRMQQEREEEEYARARVDQLRQEFVKEKDNVNLYWLDRTLAGETDLGKMARDSGRTVEEFAAARKRRNRIVARLMAEQNGVKHDPGEKPR